MTQEPVTSFRGNKALLPKRKVALWIIVPSSQVTAVPPNFTLGSHLVRNLPSLSSVNLSIEGCIALETSSRSQMEALSYSMWIITGMISLI